MAPHSDPDSSCRLIHLKTKDEICEYYVKRFIEEFANTKQDELRKKAFEDELGYVAIVLKQLHNMEEKRARQIKYEDEEFKNIDKKLEKMEGIVWDAKAFVFAGIVMALVLFVFSITVML